MLRSDEVEQLITVVSGMDREELVGQFQSYRGKFPLDFTNEFLAATPVERLRHIFVAVCLQNAHLPEMASSAA